MFAVKVNECWRRQRTNNRSINVILTEDTGLYDSQDQSLLTLDATDPFQIIITVEPVLRDHIVCPAKAVPQDHYDYDHTNAHYDRYLAPTAQLLQSR